MVPCGYAPIRDRCTLRRHRVVVRGAVVKTASRLVASLPQLKDNLRSELKLACWVCGRDRSEGGIANIAIRCLIVNFIEHVERLCTEIEGRPFSPQRKCFMQTEIRLEESGPYNHIA